MKQAGEMLSGQTAVLLHHPAVQDVIQRAAHLRADLRDQLDGRLSAVAKRLNFATPAELKVLRRQLRELENQVSSLENQLANERQRADRAEGSLTEAIRAQKRAAQNDLADRSRLEASQRDAEEAKARAEAALKEAEGLKAELARERTALEAARVEAKTRAASEAVDEAGSGEEQPARKGRRKKAEANEEPSAE
jgi:predicted  nucleic acid-binding Zn-ribbon protein